MTVEFKQDLNDKRDDLSIMKTLVAFANTAGGDLYIGVNDDGKVIGVDLANEVEKMLTASMCDGISPSIVGSFGLERIDVGHGKAVLRVHVDSGPFKPYCLEPKTASGIYVRRGNRNIPASLDEITRMVRENDPIPFEERISFEQELTFDSCARFCRERGLDLEPKDHFAFYNAEQQAFTNLAFICSDQARCSTVMVHFSDDEKLRMISSARSEGSIFKMYEDVTDFIAVTNQKHIELQHGAPANQVESYFVDPAVIREALVNMLIHRDYSTSPANIVHITPSKIEIKTFGSLNEGLTLEDIELTMVTEFRNKKLAHLLSQLKLLVTRGSGLRLIRKKYNDIPIEDLLKVSGKTFTISLYMDHNPGITENGMFRKVIAYMSTRQPQTRCEIQRYLEISQSSTINVLREMTERGLIVPIGGGRSRKYAIKDA